MEFVDKYLELQYKCPSCDYVEWIQSQNLNKKYKFKCPVCDYQTILPSYSINILVKPKNQNIKKLIKMLKSQGFDESEINDMLEKIDENVSFEVMLKQALNIGK